MAVVRTTNGMSPKLISRVGQVIGTERGLGVASCRDGRKMGSGLSMGFVFEVMRMLQSHGDGDTTPNVLKVFAFYILDGWIMIFKFYIKATSIFKKR